MISFVKFLKVVLPIVSVTTATLTTVSLISHKKHDPDAQTKPKEINLDNFVTLSEDFKESIMLYSKDGTGENVTVEDAEKAKKLLDHLKEKGSLETFPEFETPEQAAEFLDQLPKAILKDLLKDSKFSQDELKNLDPNTLNNLGRFGEDLRSQQQQQQQQISRGMEGHDSPSPEDMPNVDVSENPNIPNIGGLNDPQMQENLKSMEDTAQKALNSAQALQNSGLLKDLENLGTDSNLQEAAKELVDNLSSSAPSISATPSNIQPPQMPDIKVSFEESTKGLAGEDNKGETNDLSQGESVQQRSEDSELSNEITEDREESNDENVNFGKKLQDPGIDSNDLPVKDDLISPEAKTKDTLTESTPETSPSTGGESSSDNLGEQNTHEAREDQLPAQNEVSSNQPHTPRDQIDLKVPPLPDLDLPNVPFDFGALNNVFDALSNLGTGGDADGLSVAELRDWASKLAKTSNSLGNLISKS